MELDDPIDVPVQLSADLGTDLLATYWPTVIMFLIAGAAIGMIVLFRRRCRDRARHPRLRVAGWVITASIAMIAALALGVNTWVGYFPSVDALQRWVDSTPREPVTVFPTTAVDAGEKGVETPSSSSQRVTSADRGHAFLSSVPAHDRKMPDAGAWVYLPPDYDAPGNTQRYPVVYALHGAPGSAADWFAGGRIDYLLDVLITTGYLPPVIVVSPDLNAGPERVDTEPLNRPGGPQIEDFVVQDVVAWADDTFRTLPDTEHRVIAGMSSGGIGSLLYGLHSPDVFGGVVSIMPYTKPYTPEVAADENALRTNSPLDIIASRPGATTQKIFLGQGDGEPTAEAEQIIAALRAQEQPATLRVLPGLEHNWTAARTIMPYGLIWAATQLEWATE